MKALLFFDSLCYMNYKTNRIGGIYMWVVFLLAAMGFAIATLLVVYIGNKVINAMKRDDEKLNKDFSKEKTNKKEKEKHE